MSGGTTPVRRRRLKDRLPVRLRHHWKPAGALCLGLAVLVYAFGDARISPYVTSASRVEADTITEDVQGTVGLYDTTVKHAIQLQYKQTDFEKMIKEFEDDGTKDSIKADLTIDGVFLQDVGIRLKGNSTLMSLRGNQGGAGGGRMPGGAGQGAPQQQQGGGGQDRGQAANGGGPGAGATGGAAAGGAGTAGGNAAGGTGAAGGDDTGGGAAAGGADAGAGRGGMGGGMTQYDLSADKPEELPLLIEIDAYVEGRAYQGEREISLRPGADEQVPLNEALALSLTDGSGQTAERYGFTTVSVNNGPEVTRLMVENPDTEYAEAIDGNGVLYKARAGGTFAYKGDDPSDYETSFRQLNKVGSQDLSPVMKLIKWVDQASDEEFAADLDKHVDVESFAKYVAAQNLLMNFDDMAGPGKNYLLWYDLDTKKFSVLGWDYNLTFSGDAEAGPDDSMSMGGGGGPGGAAAEGAEDGDEAAQGQGGDMPALPEGAPEGMPGGTGEGGPQGGFPGGADGQAPDGQAPGGDAQGEDGQAGGGRGGMSGHELKDRFLELDALDPAYKKAYKELYEKFFAAGAAVKALDDIAGQAEKAGVDAAELKKAVATLRTTVTARTEALAKNKEVTG
ncbi:Spore coat protein CotH [Streptomyces sp. LamerLS-316]|uniref:CotH kinase family protein n=1 Tax=unclassified Streptomyces TaxID=2593676 RepID=UPI00082385F6|nr:MULTISPECIES: CotH kinase family protein [unclassified Streptomyces]MYQ37897.1 spore coat protein CotH [Streptomyces sp. SID4921]SCK47674.1 Spore coat protein CotH [Streptomyces sp. LamerLS-316]